MNIMTLNRFLPRGIHRRLAPQPLALLAPLSLLFLALVPPAITQNAQPFDLRDGDRVVLVGDTLIEREQAFGHLEYVLTTHYPERNVIFRNLGWSADTPLGASRAGFDTPDKGFAQLTNQLALVKPTVAIVGYGMAASFNGEAGLEEKVGELVEQRL